MSILFLFPPPFTKERLTPKLRANFLTDGLACAVLFSSLCTLSPIGIGISLATFFLAAQEQAELVYALTSQYLLFSHF